MILIDNVQILRSRDRKLLDNVNKLEQNIESTMSSTVSVVAKNGTPTIAVNREGKLQYIHSQYDPQVEAEKFVNQFTPSDLSDFGHLFFFGIGMGYHIEAMMRKFPDKSFSCYEPDASIFYHYLSNRNLSNLPLHRLDKLYVQFTTDFLSHSLQSYIQSTREKTYFIVLPSYERIFKSEYDRFLAEFKSVVYNKRSSLHVNLTFEKRWIINSVGTLPHTLKSSNIIQTKKKLFTNKPVILVAAGPSLQEEIEHLRYIKENGLAYIFAVGSSIIALLNNNLYPDAVCSYDPLPNIIETYTTIIENNIREIPLIYGTSVGFETVKYYPGPKLHMITSQDTIAAQYLKSAEGLTLDIVSDAPSIAVVTLEMLYKLGANPIIMVGQNFAYKNNQFYSEGIQYQTSTQQRTTDASVEEMKRAFQVESVDGTPVFTNEGFNRMRMQMEIYTARFTNRDIVNTTQGGAKIANTRFCSLETLIKEQLTRRVTEQDWFLPEDSFYDLTHALNQCSDMENEIKEYLERINKVIHLMQEMQILMDHKDEKRLKNIYPPFDKAFKRLVKGKVFQNILLPMNRVEYEVFGRNITAIRFEQDIMIKSKRILDLFGNFLYKCRNDIETIYPLIQQAHASIQEEIALSATGTVQS